MSCLLCLCVECDELLIDASSAEGQRLKVAYILHTHFRCCFSEEPIEGLVCQKCWVKVSVFHEFYTYVEYVHQSKESVFAECMVDNIKSSDPDDWELPPIEATAVFGESGDEKSEIVTKAEKRRLSCSDSDHFDNDDSQNIQENSEPSPAEESNVRTVKKSHSKNSTKKPAKKKCRPREYNRIPTSEISYELNINNEPQRKRGRPRKDDPVKPRSTKCNRCPLEFTSFSALSRHIKVVHIILPFRCKNPRCVDSFATQEEHDVHFASKHRQFECPHCNKMFLESTIRTHIQMQHQSKESNQTMCDLCGKISGSKSLHQAHYRKWHEEQGKVQCDICKQWTKHKDSLRRHMIRIHMNSGPQTCAECGHISPNLSALKRHSKIHLPGFKTRYKCEDCGRGFHHRKNLVEHSHIHTGFAGSYHCEDCGKVFRFSSSFSVHKKKMHPK